MQLATYYSRGVRIGVVVGDRLWDLRRAYELYLIEVERAADAASLARELIPPDMTRLIRMWHGRTRALERAVGAIVGDQDRCDWLTDQGIAIERSRVRLLAPLPRPSLELAVGSTYRESLENWARAVGRSVDEFIPAEVKPSFFKGSGNVIGDGDVMHFPKDIGDWDYECELVVVMGAHAFHIEEVEADEYIFGYTVGNDASVRNVPELTGGNHGPRAKGADTLCALGPWITTREGLSGDVNALDVRCWVGDDLRTETNTSRLMWRIQRMVSVCSQIVRLGPGDVIFTGASPGTGFETGQLLRVGDVVRMEIEGIGLLTNSVGEPH